jgi:hypothetical protein
MGSTAVIVPLFKNLRIIAKFLDFMFLKDKSCT